MPHFDRPRWTAATANFLSRWTPYLDTELHTLTGLVKPGDVCVDVGSAAGLYSQALSQSAGPTGWVHSIEPVTFSHPFWTRVLGTRSRDNITHHPLALGAEPGREAIRVPFTRRGPATSRAFLAWKSQSLGSTSEFLDHVDMLVDVETLDGLCAREGLRRVDFLKIDVEGGELHVLQGGQRTVETHLPTMLLEIEKRHTDRYEYSPDEVRDWLVSRGYRMYAWRRGWHPVDRVCPHRNNYLFRPVDRANGTT
ncbi:FkbM family methyltransferase [Saccharomonospora piscinae]|uniref:FkbM family methyltransferase n=1 Tax=Saccharomonospora piscinae TaxID=687388 RepID=UPI0004B4F95D|nr:FkbM family methyltransferase [Saccharomonospora piscinae]